MKGHRGVFCLAAFLAAVVLLAASCSGSGNAMLGGGGDGGRVQFMLSGGSTTTAAATTAVGGGATGGIGAPVLADDDGGDDDSRLLQSAEVTFSSILARNLDGQLIDVTIALPATVDVLTLTSDHDLALPVGFLPPGTYDQIVVVINKVTLVTQNGTRFEITPPGGGWTVIVPTEPFTVVEGETTTVHLRFHRERSFALFDGHFEFHPEFDCDVDD
ncbi:MAG TPA: DUF4382 domain-containing protein [Candidatus Polarisedimenticolaceae bacterium]|nr:DUF4382 domain-containing protein [Candidatus Polarisedimenticolaceae bacterium]